MYQIVFTPHARRAIRRIPRNDQQLIQDAIDALAATPRPDGVVKMRGYERLYRIRVRNYRVLYEIHDEQLLVLVVDADQRKDIYR